MLKPDSLNPASCADAIAMAEAFANGLSDPVIELEAALTKAAATDHVFISLSSERARREAEASAARWKARQPLSRLDGVPVAWKDLFDVAGNVTTAGAEVHRRDAAATADAITVGALARAGLVSVGKTNLSEFAYSGLGLNPHFGTPANSHGTDQPRIPGGSSSGAGVAVAAGIVPIAMGTDTAGSIRIPAALNGVVGFRPSGARYSREGVFPLSDTLDTVGPLTRSVRDLLAVDDLLKGRIPSHLSKAQSLVGQRFWVDEASLFDPRTEAAVRDNLMCSVARLKDAGAQVDLRPCHTFQSALTLIEQHGWLGSAEAFALHEALLDSPDAAKLDPRVRRRLEAARSFPASRLIHLYDARKRLQAQLSDELEGAFLITPTVAHVAPPLAPLEADDDLFIKTNLATLRLTMPGSLLDLPGVSLPSGVSESGLPTGLLLSVPVNDDLRLLRTALAVEAALRAP